MSVIVPVRNGAETIAACIASLLAQDYPKDRYEVIVVENRSTDGTWQLLQHYPVQRVSETAVQSSYAARNRGIQAAQGDILAFTDADCVAAPDWLRRGVAAFTDSRIGGAAGQIAPMPPATLAQRYAVQKGALSQRGALHENAFRPAAYTANAFYRKDALQRAGLFDPSVKSGGDADLAWRVQEGLGLSVVYCRDAVVRHAHRERVKDLLRQRSDYGYGAVVNYLKYRDRMERRTLKHAYWELRTLARRVGRLLAAALRCAGTFGRDAALRERTAIEGLDVLVFFARKSGQWHAALQHRVWYF